MAQELSAMLGQVMADPQFAALVQNLRQNMDLSQSGSTAQVLDLSALMEKLPGMVSMLSAMSGTASGTGALADTDNTNSSDSSNTVVSSVVETKKVEAPMQVLFRPEAREKRNKLLSALKPYLSPARCAMIDRAMSAMQLGELLGTMGSTGLGPQTREG